MKPDRTTKGRTVSPQRARLAAAVAVTLVAAACSSNGDSAGSAATPDPTAAGTAPDAPASGTLVLTNLDEPDPIDPAAYTHTMARTLVRNVYDPLVYYELGTTELEGYLATDWAVSDDGLIYTFTLRDDVTFHDGTAFTAEDVKASFDRVQDLNLTPATFLQEVTETRVVDPLTVEVELERPYQFFLGQLAKVPIQDRKSVV